jgi:hypothetical protein
MRSTLLALTVAIVGVVALDTTAIVASPETTAPAATPTQPTHDNSPLRLLIWSHTVWLVFPNSANGPDGPKSLSDSPRAAHVDSTGRLHLRITKVHGKWRGVQLESLAPLNYGTYRFVTGSPLGALAKPIVLGMFVYKPSAVRYTNEIDLENSRSLIGLGYPRDAQYVVQPYKKPSNIRRYAILNKYKTVTQQFDWQPHKVDFLTTGGPDGQGKRLGEFHYRGPDAPEPSNEHVYINLHLHNKRPLSKGSRQVILNSYSYNGP